MIADKQLGSRNNHASRYASLSCATNTAVRRITLVSLFVWHATSDFPCCIFQPRASSPLKIRLNPRPIAAMAQRMDPSYYANLPAGSPPPGVIPNFDHPQSRAFEVHTGMGICIGVTSVLVLLRVYVKLAVTHMWGWDDCESSEAVYGSKLTAIGACLIGFVSQGLVFPSPLP